VYSDDRLVRGAWKWASMLGFMEMHYEIDVPDRTMNIHGGSDLGSTIHSIIPDRIEAGTYAVAALMSGDDLRIRPVKDSHIHQRTRNKSDWKHNCVRHWCFGNHLNYNSSIDKAGNQLRVTTEMCRISTELE